MAIPFNSLAQPNWQFIPSLSVSEEYDSNVYSTKSGVEDYVTKIGPDFNATYNGSELGFQGEYLLYFNTYARHSKGDLITHDGNVNVALNRWFQRLVKGGDMTVTEHLTYSPDLQGNFSAGKGLTDYGISIMRSNIFRNSSGVNIMLPFTHVVSMTASYSNILTRYSNSLYRDNMTNTAGLGLRYSLKYDTLYSNFDASAVRVEKTDSNNYSLTFGVKHQVSQTASFDVNIGGTLGTYESGKDSMSLNGSASFAKRFKLQTYSGGYSRSINTTSGISNIPTVADVYYLSVANEHSQYVRSGLRVSYSNNRSVKGNDVDTDSYNFYANLNYSLNKWLKCSFAISNLNQRSSRLTVSDMERNLLTFTISGKWD